MSKLMRILLVLAVLSLCFIFGTAIAQEARFRALDDLNSAEVRLGVVAGDASELVSQARFPDAELVYLNSFADLPLALQAGRIDSFLAYDSSYFEILDAYPDLTALPEPVEKSVSAFFSSKSDKGRALVADFDEFLAGLEADGTLEAVFEKWTHRNEGARVMPEIESAGENGPLNIVYAFYDYPNNYIHDGELVGANAELMLRFCMDKGYTPVIHNVSSVSSAIAGVSGEKYDICASRTVPTEERAEAVCFTSRVSYIHTYMIVRRTDAAMDALPPADPQSSAAPETAIAAAPDANEPVGFWGSLAGSFEKNFIREQRWKMLMDGLLVTIGLSAFSAVLGTILGALICYIRMRKNRFASAAAAAYVKLFQGTPIVVLLLVLYYVIFGSTDMTAFAACVLGFSLDFSAYVSEMIRSGIEAVPTGQKKAALALGYGQTKAFLEIILPQAVRHILPVYSGQLVAMVKMTAIAGYISVEDLTKAADIIRSRTYEAFFPLIFTALIYFLLASMLTGLLKLIQRRTDPLNRRRLPKGVK